MNELELGPDEMSVIAAARAAHAPTELQRARVRRGLDAKLAAGVAAPLLASSALAMASKVGAAIVIVASVGAGVAYVAVPRPANSPHTPSADKVVPAEAPAMLEPAPTTVPAPLPVDKPAALPAVSTRPLPSRPHAIPRRREAGPPAPADLAGELALLTSANAATNHGDVTRADELLRTYDQRHPSGQLTQERSAAGILLLCASGREQAARVEARRFLERWPRSPLVARINSSCAAKDNAP